MIQIREHWVSSSILVRRVKQILCALYQSSFWPCRVFSLNWYSPASQNIWKWELSEETLKWFQCFYLSKLSVKINYMPKMSCWPSWVALKGCCGYKLWCKHQQPCRKRTRSALLQHAASGKYSAGHSLLSFPAKSTCCHQYQCCLCPFPSTERTVWYIDSLNK